MAEKAELIKCSWPELGLAVRIQPMLDNRPLFDWFRNSCPTSAVQSHAVVSGELTYVLNLPVKEGSGIPYPSLKGHDLLKSAEGYVWAFATFGRVASVMIKYGPISEPMSYPAIGTVVPEDMEVLRQAGRAIWNAIYNTKQIISVEFTSI